MNQEPDEKLMSDDEWAELIAAEYQTHGSPIDTVAKARVWQSLDARVKLGARPKTRTSGRSWLTALAAGIIGAIGMTQLLRQGEGGREKGDAPSIPASLTPYVLEQDGETSPAASSVRQGTTVVFRTRASQEGIYALVVSEGGAPLRLAVDEGEKIGSDDRLITKNGAVYGIRLEKNSRVCVVVGRNREDLSKHLENLNEASRKFARESCVSLEAHPP